MVFLPLLEALLGTVAKGLDVWVGEHMTEASRVAADADVMARAMQLVDRLVIGIGVLPDYITEDFPHLVRVLPEWKPVGAFAETIYAIRPYAPHVPRAVAALVGHLRVGLAGGFGV